MKFALLVTAAPFSTQGADTALRFARAAIHKGHSIERIFFFRDGVHNANAFSIAPQDETNIPSEWQTFCQNNSIDAVACVSAALRRGIVDTHESQRHNLTASNLTASNLTAGNLAAGIEIGGLGLLTDAIINADRVLTFG
jgi:tRNA 2-thiouridine synthesizing protein D